MAIEIKEFVGTNNITNIDEKVKKNVISKKKKTKTVAKKGTKTK